MSEFYTIKQASNLLGIKVRTCREWIHNGKLKGFKDPKTLRWSIPKEEICKASGGKKNGNS